MSNASIYQALRKGPQTEAQLRKASKLDADEFDAAFAQWQERMWVLSDDDPKTPKFSLTEQGQIDMRTRYPD